MALEAPLTILGIHLVMHLPSDSHDEACFVELADFSTFDTKSQIAEIASQGKIMESLGKRMDDLRKDIEHLRKYTEDLRTYKDEF